MNILKEDLIGVWHLDSWVDENDAYFPLGENIEGQLIYSKTGDMSVIILAENRKKISEGGLFFGAGQERVNCFNTSLSYFGKYSIENNIVIHHIKGCSYPNWAGTTQMRKCVFNSPTEMTLTAEINIYDGSEKVTNLTWVNKSI